MRPIIGIIGAGKDLCTKEMYDFASELGNSFLENGYRIVTGGKGGVMEAVCSGAMNSESYFEGSIIAIIPEDEKKYSNRFSDIIIPTGIGINRNSIIINTADILVALGGGSGTLSEIAFAWQKQKYVLCVTIFDGWAKKLAGEKLDNSKSDYSIPVENIEQIIEIINSKT